MMEYERLKLVFMWFIIGWSAMTSVRTWNTYVSDTQVAWSLWWRGISGGGSHGRSEWRRGPGARVISRRNRRGRNWRVGGGVSKIGQRYGVGGFERKGEGPTCHIYHIMLSICQHRLKPLLFGHYRFVSDIIGFSFQFPLQQSWHVGRGYFFPYKAGNARFPCKAQWFFIETP